MFEFNQVRSPTPAQLSKHHSNIHTLSLLLSKQMYVVLIMPKCLIIPIWLLLFFAMADIVDLAHNKANDADNAPAMEAMPPMYQTSRLPVRVRLQLATLLNSRPFSGPCCLFRIDWSSSF